jgi:DNA-directed RNA polymerase II subunit RPB1
MSSNQVQFKKTPSKVVGIQFSILSPDEIRKGSVVEITSKDTYINNKPVANGLFDPRMGVLEPGLICPTDGLDYMQTPGYFGHIELGRPIFYIQYFGTVMKILRCICFKCSKLLISKEKYKHVLDMSPEARWSFIFSVASKVKRCGEDISDGCGCKRPIRIKKEGIATLVAQWESSEKNDLNLTLTPEIVLKIFRRISDEDVEFMGFSPIWSRPDWMICQVLAVPPPAVRPSVKQDSQQRSEDDLTHIMVNIIKANQTLKDKIKSNAKSMIINEWTNLVQYFVSTLVDNKISGVNSVAQRSGRPLKSIKERLNGKGGRVRGNLMGKRVDFSARSVITPDPNLSMRELGVPIKIAMNLTKPVVVNKLNKLFLLKLVKNGPDVYPGSKILERKNGNNISLRYVDRNSLVLEEGDTVHRHMLDGDAILFNRQPTLHRMSMMCHIVRVMPVGDTFRMNVSNTKPYNADFDGDEMNLHMPQDIESESELINLAATPWQIISPQNNKTIIGIFQDSLLGSYRFTRENINFTPRQAMNLLMNYDKVDVTKINTLERISNFDLISQILPPMTLKYKTNSYKDAEDYKTSNNVVEIENGRYKRGHIDKGVLADGGKGLLQRICNDFGNMKGSEFVDSLQGIITEYMKSSAYSVGVSDLIADKKTNDAINEAITKKKKEVYDLIDQTHLGIFENKTGKTDEEEFETQINNILNKATSESGTLGLNSLSKDNRFVIMVKSGSKGSSDNISQMISCLGQQNVDGKRIPYGFEDRTLPHFTKYDDSPSARGFVENSFISGLTPEELFFHAMGGRVGLIDTAVKTSQTGYIQRRLVKGLEDIKVEYDMTVRNNKRKIIQFAYGEDGFDTVKIENQALPLMKMSLEEIYAHFQAPSDDSKKTGDVFTTSYTNDARSRLKEQHEPLMKRSKDMIDFILKSRTFIADKVFKKKDNHSVHLPVAFSYIISNVQGQQMINANSLVDITPLEAYNMIDDGFERLMKIHYVKPTRLFETLYYYYLTPKELLMVKRFNKHALNVLIEQVIYMYKKAIIAPGEMVGIIAAQSIGEPTTQMTLNTFHLAGVASKSNVTRGVHRIEEILSLSDNPKNPSCTIYMKPDEELQQENAQKYMHRIEHTNLRTVVDTIEICYDPNDMKTMIEKDETLMTQYYAFENMMKSCLDQDEDQSKKSKWIIRMEMNIEEMLERNLSMDDIHFAIKNVYRDQVTCVFSDYNSDNLVFRLRLTTPATNKKRGSASGQNPLDQQDEIYLLKTFQDNLLDNLILRGVKNIERVIPRKILDSVIEENGMYVKKETWVLDTVGTNLLDVLALDYIDSTRTFTNDIQEIYRVLGIEAARQAILNEITEAFDTTYINYHHLTVLCDRMTCNDGNGMVSIFRHGINNDNIGPIAKASFEETPEMFLKAARHGELDTMRGVSANVMCGQEGYFGTSAFQLVLDMEKMKEVPSDEWNEPLDDEEIIQNKLDLGNVVEKCSVQNITIENNISNIVASDMGVIEDYDAGF